MQNRFKSKLAWASLLALLVFILKTYFNIQIAEADKLIDLLLMTATGLGIFNNPTNGEGY
jgi:uncharacterized membrane protein